MMQIRIWHGLFDLLSASFAAIRRQPSTSLTFPWTIGGWVRRMTMPLEPPKRTNWPRNSPSLCGLNWRSAKLTTAHDSSGTVSLNCSALMFYTPSLAPTSLPLRHITDGVSSMRPSTSSISGLIFIPKPCGNLSCARLAPTSRTAPARSAGRMAARRMTAAVCGPESFPGLRWPSTTSRNSMGTRILREGWQRTQGSAGNLTGKLYWSMKYCATVIFVPSRSKSRRSAPWRVRPTTRYFLWWGGM
mmetsp:Transcript_21078/g.56222  ORF Transcript_21078/g.56222 Transcript_21078/m.56222 type:complete len:245 (-) Transcript_21078:725-1459(-)